MFDLEARLRLAAAISAYMRGEIDNFAFDEKVFERRSSDRFLEQARTSLWFLYDDCKRHQIRATRDDWESLRHLIAFLKSDNEKPQVFQLQPHSRVIRERVISVAALAIITAAVYLAWHYGPLYLLLPGILFGFPCGSMMWGTRERRRKELMRPQYYPFSDEDQWKQAEPLLEEEKLPQFDVHRHARAIRSPFTGKIIIIPSTLIMVFILIPILSAIRIFRARPANSPGEP